LSLTCIHIALILICILTPTPIIILVLVYYCRSHLDPCPHSHPNSHPHSHVLTIAIRTGGSWGSTPIHILTPPTSLPFTSSHRQLRPIHIHTPPSQLHSHSHHHILTLIHTFTPPTITIRTGGPRGRRRDPPRPTRRRPHRARALVLPAVLAHRAEPAATVASDR
jgi:hypothetical protein